MIVAPGNRTRTFLRVEGLEDRTVPTVVTIETLASITEGTAAAVLRLTRTDTTTDLWVYLDTSDVAPDYLANIAYFGVGEATTDLWASIGDDTIYEPTRSPTVSIVSDTGYTVGTPSSASFDILDDDIPVVSVSHVTNPSETGTPGTARFTRAGDTSSALTVNVSVGGTATPGADFTDPGSSVTFPAGHSVVDLTVAAIDDVAYDLGETVIITAASGSGYAVGSPSAATLTIADDELTPVYWTGAVNGDWDEAGNWSSNAVPDWGTAVYFDGTESNDSVTTPSDSGGVALAELHLVNGYSGTVTLASDLTVGVLEMASGSGTIDQPAAGGSISGSDLTVTGAMLWTGGTLNSTENVADATLSGATGLIAPTSGGVVYLGSNFTLANGSQGTMGEGTIAVTNGGVEFKTSTGSSLNINPGALAQAVIQAFQPNLLPPGGFIMAGTSWTLSSGAFTFAGSVGNAGTVTLMPETIFTPKGDAITSEGYVQWGSNSATYLHGDSVLISFEPVLIQGGTLATVWADSVSSGDATILAPTTVVSGGDIYVSMQTGSHTHFGVLVIDGDLTWSGGTFHPYVYQFNEISCDLWYQASTIPGGKFTITGGTVAPIYLDSDYGTSSVPQSGDFWKVLRAQGGFANNTAPAVGDPTIWSVAIDALAPPIFWKVIAN